MRIPDNKMVCPRRSEVPAIPGFPPTDYWKENECSFCGSLKPELFLQYVEFGDGIVVPTDKNYKAYLEFNNKRYKFYFMHLSEEQINKFVELVNNKRMTMDYPGYFYVLPYFCRHKDL